WGWSLPVAGGLVGLFLLIEIGYLGANLVKITHGGWFPLVVAAAIFAVMTTWRKGRQLLQEHLRERTLPVDLLVEELGRAGTVRVPGTAIVMTREADGVPPVLLHHFKHNKVLHEQVVLLSILSEEIPVVTDEQRANLEVLGAGLFRIVARYGFMETPNVPDLLESCRCDALSFREMETTYILGRESLLVTGRGGMARWRKRLFAILARNANSATAFYCIPPNRVVELGAQVVL
ncbi:MAG: KUP/HAK/KT family potassium transporter, partial [Gemmatimonadota bacterium]